MSDFNVAVVQTTNVINTSLEVLFSDCETCKKQLFVCDNFGKFMKKIKRENHTFIECITLVKKDMLPCNNKI